MPTTIISGGVNSSGLTVSSGEQLQVKSAANLVSSTIDGGGTVVISSGGNADVLTISSGGILTGAGILLGHNTDAGEVSGITLGTPTYYDPEDFSLEIQSGGSVADVSIDGSLLQIDQGVTLSGSSVSLNNSAIVKDYGVAVGFVVDNQSLDYVESGGVATNTQVSDGGTELVLSGGVASGSVVGSGGTQTVSSGATASGTVVFSGGAENLVAGAILSDVTVSSGGTLSWVATVSSGQTLTAGVYSSDGVLDGVTLVSGAILDPITPTVLSGGSLTVAGGEYISAVTVSAGGELLGPGIAVGSVTVAGVISGVTVSTSPYGYLNLESGGVASGVTLDANTTMQLDAGGWASGTTLNGGGVYVNSGGIVVGDEIDSGGNEIISAGGLASGVIVNSAGVLNVSSGGVVSGVVVSDGGLEVLSSGATAAGVTVLSGGAIQLTVVARSGQTFSYGLVGSASALNGVTVESGGVFDLTGVVVSSGGVASGVIVTSVDAVNVLSGGYADGGAVSSGGIEYVSSGGSVSGVVVSNGGQEVLSLGATAAGVTVLSGGSIEMTVAVSSGQTFSSGLVSNTTVVSGVTVESGGVLNLTEIEVPSGGTVNTVTVISGGDGPNVLSAGPGYVTLIGGPWDDELIAGSGNDILDGGGSNAEILGGTGYDTLIGGSGQDTFVFDAGYGATLIYGFKPGVDKIEINGYSSWLSLSNSGSVVISFTNSVTHPDEIVLEGISASQISLSDFVFNSGPSLPAMPTTPTPTGAPAPGPFPTGDLTIPVGTTDYFNTPLNVAVGYTEENSGTVVVEYPGAQSPSTEIFGSSSGVRGGSYTSSNGGEFENTSTGALYVEGENNVVGFYSNACFPTVTNDGLIQVVSQGGDAWGITLNAFPIFESSNPSTFTNATGATLDIWASQIAYGAAILSGTFINQGVVDVAGYDAIGVQSPANFDNSGTFTVTEQAPTSQSVGSIAVDLTTTPTGLVVITGQAPTTVQITNTGTITADYAVYVDPGYGYTTILPGAKYAPAVTVDNSGDINGILSLGDGGNIVVNTGDIVGAVDLGDGNNTYDGAGGDQSGGIYLGEGTNQVVLGNDGEFVFGQGGSDTITGGAGNDYVEIGRGDDTLDGGGGVNTLSFGLSDVGVQVNVAAGTANVGGSLDSFKNFQDIIGSPYADVIVGGPGNDVLDGGGGGDTLTGGSGDNTFVFKAGYGQLVITNFDPTGQNDQLLIYGYSGAESVQQSGANTVIQMSTGDSILLQGVEAASLTADDIVYSASAEPAVADLPPAPPLLDSTTLDLAQNFTIQTGQTVDIEGRLYGILDSGTYNGQSYSGSESIDNHGTFEVTAHYWVSGVYVDGGQGETGPAVLTNEAGCIFSVSNDGAAQNYEYIGYLYGGAGDAIGLFDGGSINLYNAGEYTVNASEGDAFGVVTYSAAPINNTGAFDVTASGNAYGVVDYNGVTVWNSGSITIQGATATGISNSPSYYAVVDNSGSISVQGTTSATGLYSIVSLSNEGSIIVDGPGATAVDGVGVLDNAGLIEANGSSATAVDQGIYGGQAYGLDNSGTIEADATTGTSIAVDIAVTSAVTINNSGLISADQAFVVDQLQPSPPSTTEAVTINNYGSIEGNIEIDYANGAIYNAGTIVGDITLGTIGDGLYDGIGGRLTGSIDGDNGNETIIGGVGPTVVTFDVASSQATVTHNANGSWTVTTSTMAADTLINVTEIQFTNTNEFLAAPSADSITISETAAYIDAALNNLNTIAAVGHIIVADNLPVTVTGAELTDDKRALGLLQDANGSPVVLTMAGGPAADFNGDGKSDILIQGGNGVVEVGELVGGQESYAVVTGLGPEWSFHGSGDFLGKGQNQFLIENTSGAIEVGEVSGGSTSYTVVGGLGPEWSFKETGDFLGNGQSQFLIENTSGAVEVGNVVGGQAQYTLVGGLGPEWSFVGAGDYLGNGQDQFLIRNSSGAVVVGNVAGGAAQLTQVGALGAQWRFEGSGDFLGDGKTQVLVWNTDGAVDIGEVGSGNQLTLTQVGTLASPWAFEAAGDYAGTGTDSFVIQNTSTGVLETGTVVAGALQFTQVGGLGSEWSFPTAPAPATAVAPPVDDLLGQGVSDLLIQNTSGAVEVGQLSGGQVQYSLVGALGPEWSFRGTGDFLGDGHSQFLIENTSGMLEVGNVVSGQTQYAVVGGLGPEWSFEGTGDFLGDGQDQFLIENTSGVVEVGNVVGGQAQYAVVSGLGPEWSFKGTGDFLGDGQSDFLIENTNGAIEVGEVAGGQVQYTLVGGLGPEWSFRETGDFLGNGQSQFLIENTSGVLELGNIVDGKAQYSVIGGLGPEWSIVGAGDYAANPNAPGAASFLIENTSGVVEMGTVVAGQAQYAVITGLGSEWKVHG